MPSAFPTLTSFCVARYSRSLGTWGTKAPSGFLWVDGISVSFVGFPWDTAAFVEFRKNTERGQQRGFTDVAPRGLGRTTLTSFFRRGAFLLKYSEPNVCILVRLELLTGPPGEAAHLDASKDPHVYLEVLTQKVSPEWPALLRVSRRGFLVPLVVLKL